MGCRDKSQQTFHGLTTSNGVWASDSESGERDSEWEDEDEDNLLEGDEDDPMDEDFVPEALSEDEDNSPGTGDPHIDTDNRDSSMDDAFLERYAPSLDECIVDFGATPTLPHFVDPTHLNLRVLPDVSPTLRQDDSMSAWEARVSGWVAHAEVFFNSEGSSKVSLSARVSWFILIQI